MKNNSAEWYEIESQHPQHQPLAQELNRLYRLDSRRVHQLEVPDYLGTGSWERTIVSSDIEITACDMNFHEDIIMSSKEQDSGTKWSFCLGAPIEWTVVSPGRSYQLQAGQMSIFGTYPVHCKGLYEAGKSYRGITIKLSPVLMAEWGQAVLLRNHAGEPFYTQMAPFAVQRILQQMSQVDYEGNLKRMYLEGKVLELAAVFLHELSSPALVVQGLSRTDVDSLMRARQILDEDLLAPPTIQQLSRLVCLNEFKLKKGFKQLFGTPVHAYVMDRRLQAAYDLLQRGNINITMAAVACGFSNPSRFAEKFKVKYGESPSKYFGMSKNSR